MKVGVDTIYFNGKCRLVRGVMVSLKGVLFEILYKLDVIIQIMNSGNAL